MAVYDGSYTFIIFYENGTQHQTTVSFATPGTLEPIPQPTQKPEYTSFSHLESKGSPIELRWEPCENSDLFLINVEVTNTNTREDILDIDLLGNATELGELVYLDDGNYEIDLAFEIEYNNVNQDGVQFELSKWNEVDYLITIKQ